MGYNRKEIPSLDKGSEDYSVAVGQLRSIIERIERLDEEKKALSEDMKSIFTEAKVGGFDTKAIRAILKIKKKEKHERQEEEAMIELYKGALGIE